MNIRRIDFMAEDTTIGMIQSWLDSYKGDHVCTYLIYNECYKMFGKPDPKATIEINSIMNNTIEGWKPGKQHRYPQYVSSAAGSVSTSLSRRILPAMGSRTSPIFPVNSSRCPKSG